MCSTPLDILSINIKGASCSSVSSCLQGALRTGATVITIVTVTMVLIIHSHYQ